ncbi:hypothetical protein FQA39_LY12197 [Lamprigera yunnana]|nr:hypothetical protein FQA39_LY12197 [Lamprigera yunnana]
MLALFTALNIICTEGKLHTGDVHKIRVTPTGRHAISFNDDCWKPKNEEEAIEGTSKASESPSDEISRTSEVRQSKTKRVKNYLKKCKNAIGNKIGSSETSDTKNAEKDLEVILNKSEVHELEEVFENVGDNVCLENVRDLSQIANVVDIIDKNEDNLNSKNVENRLLDTRNKLQSPFLNDAQENVDCENDNDEENVLCKELTESKEKTCINGERDVNVKFCNYI